MDSDVVLPHHCPRNADLGDSQLQKRRARNTNKNQAAGLQQVKCWPNPSPAGRPGAVAGGPRTWSGSGLHVRSWAEDLASRQLRPLVL